MPTGALVTEGGWIASETDVDFAGSLEWGKMTGIEPTNPLVGGPGYAESGAMEPDRGLSRVMVTQDAGATGLAGPIDGRLLNRFDDWRDLFDFKGSPTPWVLLFMLAAVGFIQTSVSARVGPARAGARLG